MDRKTLLAASLAVALALAGTSGAALAQPDEGATDSLTGTLMAVVDGDGVTDYYLELADGSQARLSLVGPPWFWGEANPFEALVDQEITVEGYQGEGVAEQAADVAKEHAAADAPFLVMSIDAVPVWTGPMPPWASGPAVVGESHPGFEGWSKGQAAKAAGRGNADGKAGGPAVVGESHPGFEGWSKGQAAKAAREANAANADGRADNAQEGRGRS